MKTIPMPSDGRLRPGVAGSEGSDPRNPVSDGAGYARSSQPVGQYGEPGSMGARTPSRGRVSARPQSMPKPGASPIFVLFGCKGGVGATTLAVNMAVNMAQSRTRGVVLVDLDLQMGDVLCAMNMNGLHSKATITDFIDEIEGMHGAAVRRRLAQRDGVYLLSQGGVLQQLDRIDPRRISDMLQSLAQHFDAVIVDGVRDFGDISLGALDVASKILFVLTQEVPAVRGAARARDVCRMLGYSDQKMALVVNRLASKAILGPEAVAEALELPVLASLGNDSRNVGRAMNHGLSLRECAPRAKITRELQHLAEVAFTGMAAGRPGIKKRGAFAELMHRLRKALRRHQRRLAQARAAERRVQL